jgi:hypothetical protein
MHSTHVFHGNGNTVWSFFLFVESYVLLKWPDETDTYVFAHIGLTAPVLVRSPKLSRAKSGQYLGGRPPGNTGW